MAPKRVKPPAVGTGAVTDTQVAFMVECYLRDNHFVRTLEEFRSEASRILLPMQTVPKGARRLCDVLNDYVVLKQEQLSFASEKERMQHLFQGLQDIVTMYHSGGTYQYHPPLPHPPLPHPPLSIASMSSPGFIAPPTTSSTSVPAPNSASGTAPLEHPAQQHQLHRQVYTSPSILEPAVHMVNSLKRKVHAREDVEGSQGNPGAGDCCQQADQEEAFRSDNNSHDPDKKIRRCAGGACIKPMTPACVALSAGTEATSSAVLQAAQPSTPPMNAFSKSQQVAVQGASPQQPSSPPFDHGSQTTIHAKNIHAALLHTPPSYSSALSSNGMQSDANSSNLQPTSAAPEEHQRVKHQGRNHATKSMLPQEVSLQSRLHPVSRTLNTSTCAAASRKTRRDLATPAPAAAKQTLTRVKAPTPGNRGGTNSRSSSKCRLFDSAVEVGRKENEPSANRSPIRRSFPSSDPSVPMEVNHQASFAEPSAHDSQLLEMPDGVYFDDFFNLELDPTLICELDDFPAIEVDTCSTSIESALVDCNATNLPTNVLSEKDANCLDPRPADRFLSSPRKSHTFEIAIGQENDPALAS